jgi:GNAT superfamily N-acetyltransferase
MNMEFIPPDGQEPGILFNLLKRSYADLVLSDPVYWKPEEQKWMEFDRDVYQNPDTIGQCVFMTRFENEIIGFGSYNPLQRPEFSIVGHNCILPALRGNGFGNKQILEILNRFRSMGIRKAKVSTSEHPFFLPAQKMYLSCGFKETGRALCEVDPRFRLIEYELVL